MRTLGFLLLTGLFCGSSLGAEKGAALAMDPGLILVAKVVGGPRLTQDGRETWVKVDDKVPAKSSITTRANEIVVLVFSNGMTVQIAADSTVVVEEFLQAPFSGTLKIAELEVEPSTSQTKLRLIRGELIGQVKKLALADGSSFALDTPKGVIEPDPAIGGGIFQVIHRPLPSGELQFEFKAVTRSFKLRSQSP